MGQGERQVEVGHRQLLGARAQNLGVEFFRHAWAPAFAGFQNMDVHFFFGISFDEPSSSARGEGALPRGLSILGCFRRGGN